MQSVDLLGGGKRHANTRDCSARDKQWTASEAIQETRSKGNYCVQHFLLDEDTIIENYEMNTEP